METQGIGNVGTCALVSAEVTDSLIRSVFRSKVFFHQQAVGEGM